MGWWDVQKMKALSGYLQGLKPREIVQDLTVTEQTVRHWMEHPKFKLAVATHQKDIIDQVKAVEAEHSTEAILEVIRIMREGNSRDRTKLAAAKLILDRAAPVVIEKLEQQSASVKVVIVNNNTLGEGTKTDILDFEREMGYDKVVPPMLRRELPEGTRDVTNEEDI
jgi:hypothetical protein